MTAINPGLIPGNSGDYPTGIFFPYACNITAISQEINALITFSQNHMFSVGNQVLFQIPRQYGMQQLAGMSALVLSIPAANQITVNVSTVNFDAFSVPSLAPNQVIDPAMVLPIGTQNTGYQEVGNTVPFQQNTPGSFTVTLFPGG